MSTPHSFAVIARLWKYTDKGAWFFVTLPVETARSIENAYGPRRRGWGSIPVTVQIGISTWQTSIFPDKGSGSYLLPLKKSVREREQLKEDDMVSLVIRLRGVQFVS